MRISFWATRRMKSMAALRLDSYRSNRQAIASWGKRAQIGLLSGIKEGMDSSHWRERGPMRPPLTTGKTARPARSMVLPAGLEADNPASQNVSRRP